MRARAALFLTAVAVAATPVLHDGEARAVQVCPEGVCRALACGGTFVGFANWDQNVAEQSDQEQDQRMDAACAASYPRSRAATTNEIAAHCIPSMPAENTSGRWLTGRCPGCVGRGGWSPRPVSGHCRTCVRPGNALPDSRPPDPSWSDYCCVGNRSAACVR